MKRMVVLLSAIFFSVLVSSQIPQKMSYQAVIRNSNNQLVTNQQISMRISILQGSSNGTVVYTETHNTTTNSNGLITVEIGGAVGFDAIDWSNGPFFLKTETDPQGGNNYTITGVSQLLSVPFAFYAKTTQNYSETDPVFMNHAAYGINISDINNWNAAYGWGNHATQGYLKSYTETDPVFSNHVAYGITSSKINHWDEAYSWGNHATQGYLKSYTESDPVFNSSAAKGISSTNISQWNTAYSWGNHATAGYLKSESDPVFDNSPAKDISSTDISHWNTAYSWGNHANAGYLKSYTETDPVFNNSAAKNISSTNISDWNTAYSWGNHASAGYLKSETDPVFNNSAAKNITSTNINQWNTAYSWGNHATAGYLKSETDPQVGNQFLNYVPKWNGNNLVSGTIIDNNGMIGIGISNPSQKLEVNGTVKATSFQGNGYSLTNIDYNNLINKPDFSGWDTNANDDFSGNYNDLTNKPSLSGIMENGNSVGAYNLDMNQKDINNVDDINMQSGSVLIMNNASKILFNNGEGDNVASFEGASGGIDEFYCRIYNQDQMVWLDENNNWLTIIQDAGTTGNLLVSGNLNVYGTKNFVMTNPKNPNEEIHYSCLEGGEAGVYFRGKAKLINGTAVIKIPNHFTLVSEKEGLTANVTPAGNCKGLFVEKITNTELVVKELSEGRSNVEFYFIVYGIRKGYKDFQIIKKNN